MLLGPPCQAAGMGAQRMGRWGGRPGAAAHEAGAGREPPAAGTGAVLLSLPESLLPSVGTPLFLVFVPLLLPWKPRSACCPSPTSSLPPSSPPSGLPAQPPEVWELGCLPATLQAKGPLCPQERVLSPPPPAAWWQPHLEDLQECVFLEPPPQLQGVIGRTGPEPWAPEASLPPSGSPVLAMVWRVVQEPALLLCC